MDIVKCLINRGANVNVIDQNNGTPVQYAINANKWDIVERMVVQGAKVIDLTDQQQNKLLLYVIGKDINQVNENEAFYNVVRFGNVELLKMLMKQKNLDNAAKSQDLDDILSKTYEELKLKNVPLSQEIEFAIEYKLVQLRFSAEKQDQTIPEAKVSLEDVRKRIEMTNDLIHVLKEKYSGPTGKEIDAEFIFTARFIAQNMNTLKRQLQTTYNKLPWEEIEFCIVNFISSILKPEEADVIYKLVLDKGRLFTHLGNFAEKLNHEKDNLQEKDVNRNIRLPGRCGIVETIVSNNPNFKELYSDYELIKNVYSLKRIKSYIKLASSIDMNENELLGKLVIERTLQVIGETLKNTAESPNLSDDIHKMLLYSAPKNTKDIITSLRNSLSHAHTLIRKIDFEDSKDLKFFQTVQNDLTKIEVEIIEILYKTKISAVKAFFNKVIISKDLNVVKNLCDGLNFAELEDIDLSNHHTLELATIKRLINELNDIIQDKTDAENDLFGKINNIINTEEIRLTDAKGEYIKTVRKINDSISNNIHTIKSLARTYSTIMESSKLQNRALMLKKVTEYVIELEKYSSPARLKKMLMQSPKCFLNLFKIVCISEYDIGRITAINGFKQALEKIEDDDENEPERNKDNIFIKIQNKFKSAEDKLKLQKELDIHERKQKLTKFLDQKLKGDDIELIDKVSYDKFIKMLKLQPDYEKSVKSYYDSKDFKNCKGIIKSKINDRYGIFLQKISRLSLFSSEKYIKYLKELLAPLKLGKLDDTIKEIVQEIQQEIKFYYEQRLKILKQLIDTKSDQTKSGGQDKALIQTGIEILVLDLLEILKHATLFGDNKGFFDDENSPVLIGKFLRNYLAHGNTLIDTLPLTPSVATISNAAKLIQEGEDLVVAHNILIGQRKVRSNLNLNEHYVRSLNIVINQHDMFVAAKEGNLQKVKSCIHKGADVRARDINGWTGLHFAIAGDSVEMFNFFREQNINVKDIYDVNLAYIGTTHGSINIIKYFLKQNKLNVNYKYQNQNEKTLLHNAAENGHQDIVEILLVHGADLASKTNDGATALYLAVKNGHKDVFQVLLLKGCEINAKNKDGITALHHAATNDYKDIVQILLKHGADPNSQDEDGRTALHLAAEDSHEEVVRTLLKNKADVNVKNKYGFTAMCSAGGLGHKDVVQVLLEHKSDVEAKINGGWTTLHLAAQNAHNDVIRKLLDHKANVNTKSTNGRTPLHLAARFGRQDVVQMLLENEADVNDKDKDGETALHVAAQHGKNNVVRILLDNVADVNAKANDGWAALHYAALNDHEDVAQTLLKYEAKINAKTNDGVAALHLAADNGHKDVVAKLLANKVDVNAKGKSNGAALHYAARNGYQDVVQILLEHGADVAAKLNGGWTALHSSAKHGHKDVVRILLKNKADVNAKGESDFTALHLAAQNGFKNVVQELLGNEADVNARDNDFYGWTALHLAADKGFEDVVRVLLDKKADVGVQMSDGNTALHLAAQNGHEAVVQELLNNKAEVDAKNKDDSTALHLAAQFGHKDVVLTLLKNKASVNAKGKHGTALHIAAITGHQDVVQILCENHAHVDVEIKSGVTALHLAAENGCLDVVRILVRHANVNARGANDLTALHLAVKNSYIAVMRELLENKADVDAKAKDGLTALHIAMLYGHRNVIQTLLEHHADVNAKYINGCIALHSAAQHGMADILQQLCDKKTDINAKDRNGLTALHVAARNGYKDFVRELLDNNAEVNARDNDEWTALHVAVHRGHEGVVQELFHKNADVNAKTNGGHTPLYLAAQSGHNSVVRELLDKKADINAKADGGRTALHVAAHNGQKDVVQELLDKRADVNAKDNHEWTAVHLAVHNGHKDVVRELLGNKADVHAKSSDGVTALHLAAELGHKDIVQILLEHDADDDARNNDDTVLHQPASSNDKEVLKSISATIKHNDVNAKDNNGSTPLHLAAVNGHKDVAQILLLHHADVNAKAIDGLAALHLAAQNGNKDVVQTLLENDADVNAKNNHDTVLHRSVSSNNEQVLKLILDAMKHKFGQDPRELYQHINVQDTEGDTPLMWAAENGRITMAQILLNYGADIEIRNYQQMTALHWATKNGYREFLQLLIDNSANPNIKDNNGNTPLALARNSSTTDNLEEFELITALLMSVTDTIN